MTDCRVDFEDRLTKLDRKHRAMGKGMTASLRGDGLIVVKPKGFRPYLPARGAVMLIAGFLAFKGLMLAAIGPDAYGERVADLQSGSIFEKAGAAVMQIDPVTQTVATTLGPIFR